MRRVLLIQTQAENAGAQEISRLIAANAGVVTVVNDLPVLREVLSYRGEPAALFVDAANHGKFSAAVSRALEDDGLRQALRQNARGLKARYSTDAMVEEYDRILAEASHDAGLVRQAGTS